MKTNPLVTLYIPSRNYARFLEQSINSIINQLYTNWELIIIDEASDDNTCLIAETFVSKYPKKIKLIKNECPVGLQKLSNKILKLANGKYMMRLDADDWLDESALLLMVAKLEKTKNVGIVYGNYYYTDESGKILGIEDKFIFGSEDNSGQIPPHGACTMFRTRSLKNVGGYSEDVDAQDGWDLWFKLSNKIGAVSIKSPLFYYRQHGNSLSRDEKRLIKARTKIFGNLAKKLEGNYKPTVVAVIPVKESYPNFEKVPFQTINNKSLLEISILNACNSEKINLVIVNSESKKVLEYSEALEKNKKVPKHKRILRTKSKFKNIIPIRQFMLSAGELYFQENNNYPDIIIYLSLHAVKRKTEDIESALNILQISEADSIVSVQEEREPMFKHGKDGLSLINPGRFQHLSFDKEKLYRFNGVLIGAWWEVLKSHSMFGEKISYMEMSKSNSIQVRSKSILDTLNGPK